MKHFAYVSEIFDANAFAFLVVIIDVHGGLPPFTEYLSATHEVISAFDFAVFNEPVNDFRCGHGFFEIEFEIAYHDVGVPFVLFACHFRCYLRCLFGQSPY